MITPSEVFTLAVGPWTEGTPTQEIGTFGTVSVSSNLDDGQTVTFDVPGESPTARQIDELATDVWVYKNGVLDSRCRVIDVQQSWGANGEDTVTVNAVCYKRLFNARHLQTDLTYSSIDQAQIIWGLIQHTQAQAGGDFGITAGSLAAGNARDRSYEAGSNIGKLLDDLSGVINGPWWGISASLELDVRLYTSFSTLTTPIEMGATARSLSRQSGAALFANSVWVSGDNSGTTPVSQDEPDVTIDPRGRWERFQGYPGVVLQTTLAERANGLLEAARSPVAQWSCELDVARFLTDLPVSPGNFVELVVPPSIVAPIGTGSLLKVGQVIQTDLSLSADGSASATCEVVETGEGS